MLLSTKLHVPPARSELVSRPRLLERLNAGLDRRLTLISAPAGYGKTRLLSEWVSDLEWPVAWLSVDRGDNDVARFLAYLVAALRSLDERNGGTGLPCNLHLVIATCADPPRTRQRERGRGQLMELRQSDLRFTPQEAFAFLHRVAGLSLAEKDVGTLVDRTEGGVVGLQMAALSLRGRADASGYIEAFAGSHRLVLDYLVEEVLERQPPAIQEFLLRASILDRMNGPLCDAVTGAQDGRERLAELDRT
jgi:LuxR family maltose regulon positive regulatory protein